MIIKSMRLKEKRGQIAIYVILAVVILGLIVLFYFLMNNKEEINYDNPSDEKFSPRAYLDRCILEDFEKDLQILQKQGGYKNPEGYKMYLGDKVKYLCYTSENYKTCTVQQPFIKTHFEKELLLILQPKLEECLMNLKTRYEEEGYQVSMKKGNYSVEINPSSIDLKFNSLISVIKGEQTMTFQSFEISRPSKLYELLFTSETLVEFESVYGDSETTVFMRYYPDLSIEKISLDDGTNIYKVSDVTTQETFVFASRSLVWPAGG